MPLIDVNRKKTGVIRFLAPVDNQTVGALLTACDQLMGEGAEQIILLVSTPGGSVFHGLSAYNYLKGLPAEIVTTNFGSVDSIGIVVYCAGSTRLSVLNARFLLHGVQSNIQGPASLEEKQVEEILKGLQIDIRNIARVVAEHTKKTEDEIYQAMVNRTTLDPRQDINFGLVHRIESAIVPRGAQVVAIQK